MYDPQLARFHSIDRLAAKFAYMTPYQYCSNNPISKIEIDGLEGIWFHKTLHNNSGWNKVQKVAFNTTSHKNFEKQVKSQTKFDVVYYKVDGEASANGYVNSAKSFEEYNSMKYDMDFGVKRLDQSGNGFLLKNFDDKKIEKLFAGDKGVVFIGINENRLNPENATELSNSAATVLHEEGAHSDNIIAGQETTNADGHLEYYNNKEGDWSPDPDEVRTDPKYNGSQAKQDITETDINAKEEYDQ